MLDRWLEIIGVGEDGLAGLSVAGRAALASAEVVFGGPRHLGLVEAGARGRAWPVPFDVTPVLALRGRPVVVLASGDPFWFGASALWVLEALGGERERIRPTTAGAFDLTDVAAPVAVAVEVAGASGLPHSPGLPDAGYAHDGQITKAPVRALTLAALAPRPGAHLWDIGAGSGSVSVEWCLAGGRATAIEPRAARAANVRSNAQRFGVADRMAVVEGAAPDALVGLPPPQAIFVGGGFEAALFATLQTVAPGSRLVVNAVTLETETALLALHAQHGGELLRIELAHAAPLGRLRGWVPARPLVQWSVAL